MSRPVIAAHYPTRRAALASCRAVGGHLSLFVPTTDDVSAGTAVRLQVSFGDVVTRFELEGTITWRRTQARGLGLEPGLGVEFAAPEKYQVARMLAFCAGRALDTGTAIERRVEAEVPCQVNVGPHRLAGLIRDLSSTGVFVAGPSFVKLARGTELVIQLGKGWLGFGVKQLKARVIWNGHKRGEFGFGARFVEDSARTRPVLGKYLRTPR